MNAARPKGLTETSVLMSITNAMGWAIIDWSKRNASITFIVFTVLIFVGYAVIWFYWKGRNWARILVLLTSILSLYNVSGWVHCRTMARIMISSEAMLAVFLLYWLNTKAVKAFFRGPRANPNSA